MEHPHRCVYCSDRWFCYEECPLPGASVCESCREKLLQAPEDTPLRVIPIQDRHDSWIFDRLIEHDGERVRNELRRRFRL
jgi:hypothetical protein